jgi:hypothetical protein
MGDSVEPDLTNAEEEGPIGEFGDEANQGE